MGLFESKPIIEPILNSDYMQDNISETETLPNYKKGTIPKPLRMAVWDEYIGRKHGLGSCFTCGNEIDKMDFECGHVMAEVRGGITVLKNLRPVCHMCNTSMGSKNLLKFKQELELVKMRKEDILLLEGLRQLRVSPTKQEVKRKNISPSKSKQCLGLKSNGEQCNRMVLNDYCKTHALPN